MKKSQLQLYEGGAVLGALLIGIGLGIYLNHQTSLAPGWFLYSGIAIIVIITITPGKRYSEFIKAP